MSEQEGGISHLSREQQKYRSAMYRKTGRRLSTAAVSKEYQRFKSRQSKMGYDEPTTKMDIDIHGVTGSVDKTKSRRPRLTTDQKIAIVNASLLQLPNKRSRIPTSKNIPKPLDNKKHQDALTKKQIQDYIKRWSVTKEIAIQDRLEKGIKYKIETLNKTLENIKKQLEPLESEKLKYENQLIEKQAILDGLKTRSQRESSEYRQLDAAVNQLIKYIEYILVRIDKFNAKINRYNGLIKFYETLYATVTADKMVVDATTVDKIVAVIEAGEKMDTSEDNNELDDLLSKLFIGGKKKRGGKKTQKGGEVVGAVAEEVASLPAPMEGGKKKRPTKKAQKGGEVVGAVAEEVASQPAPMEGGKKKRGGKKDKTPEEEEAAAALLALNPPPTSEEFEAAQTLRDISLGIPGPQMLTRTERPPRRELEEAADNTLNSNYQGGKKRRAGKKN